MHHSQDITCDEYLNIGPELEQAARTQDAREGYSCVGADVSKHTIRITPVQAHGAFIFGSPSFAFFRSVSEMLTIVGDDCSTVQCGGLLS